MNPGVADGLRLRVLAVFAILAVVITLTLQSWVGPASIYAPEREAKRAQLHEAILTNTPPAAGWAAIGAAALNIRVTAVYAAEAVHRSTGLSVGRAYWVLDSVFLFLLLAALPLYLRYWLPDTWCLIGVLYLAAVLPLTYFLHAYQPWDRMSLAAWLVLLVLVRDQRPWLTALVLAISITIKFDTILIPILYALVHLERKSWVRTALACTGIALAGYAALTLLKTAFPAPAEPARFSWAVATSQLHLNVHDMATHHLRHPVLLAVGPLVLLALIGIRHRPRFMVAGVTFGAVLSGVWGIFTVYAEVRAQLALLLLLLPPALMTLQSWLEPSTSPARRPSSSREP